MTRRQRPLLRALVSGISLRASGAVLSLLAVPIAISALGQEGYAALATLLGLVGWLGLSSAGLGQATALAVAGTTDEATTSGLFWHGAITSIVCCSAVALASFIPFRIAISTIFTSLPQATQETLLTSGYYCFAAFLIMALGQAFEGTYIGKQRNDYVNWCKLVGQLVAILSLLLIWQTSPTMLNLCIAMTVGPLAGSAWFVAKGVVDHPLPSQFRYRIADALALLKQGLGFLASSLTVIFYGGGSLALFAISFGSSELATASVIARLVQIYFSILAIVLIPFSATLRRQLANDELQSAKSTLAWAGALTVGSGAVAATTLYFFGERLIGAWVRTDLAALATWIPPFATLVLVIGWSYFCIYACFATVGSSAVAKAAMMEVSLVSLLYLCLGDTVPPAYSLYIAALVMSVVSGMFLPYLAFASWMKSRRALQQAI